MKPKFGHEGAVKLSLRLGALSVFTYFFSFSAFATECGRPDGHGENISCGVITTTTILDQKILSDVEEEFQSFDLKFVPKKGQFDMLREGSVGSSFSMPSDQSGWLSSIEAFHAQMGGFDNIKMDGEYIGRSADGKVILQRPETLTFRGEPTVLENKVKDLSFWQLLMGPLSVNSVKLKTITVRTLSQIDTLSEGRTSRRNECQLTRTTKITLNPSADSFNFFKEHSTGFLGPIRATNEFKEHSLMDLADCALP